MRTGLIGLLIVLVGACTDTPTAPRVSPTPVAERAPSIAQAGLKEPIAAAGLVFCDVAARLPSGKYRVKNTPVKVPQSLFDGAVGSKKFGIVGTVKGSDDPTRLAVCLIPNSPAALDWFKAGFNVASGATPVGKAGRRGALESMSQRFRGVPNAVRDASAEMVQMVDETAVAYEVDGTCSSYAIVDYDCGCTSADCTGWGDGTSAEWEGYGPAEPDYTDYYIGDGGYVNPDGTFYDPYAPYDPYAVQAPVIISCYGQTDRPHSSSTVFGMANVHARTTCTAPAQLTVSLSLKREKCLWIFCWWSTVGSGYYANFATIAQTNAAAPCQRGWYLGSAFHTASMPGGFAFGWTRNSAYLYC